MTGRALVPVLLLAAACGGDDTSALPTLGHIALYIDTDAPLPPAAGQPADPARPPPLFDSLRIDVYLPDETQPCDECSREFRVDTGLFESGASTTIRSEHRSGGLRARVRLFRSTSVIEDDIDPDQTIETVVAVPRQPAEGVRAISVFLPTDAVGRPIASLDAPADPDEGRPKKSQVGTWAGAARTDCPGPPGPDVVCIPGGAYWMGSPVFVSPKPEFAVDRVRLVTVRPFYLDAHEVTVAEYRSSGLAVLGGTVLPFEPGVGPSGITYWCTFTAASSDHDGLPVSCIKWSAARSYCQSVRGGDLPTEAQFEYAAGGLESKRYVWGSDEASCADAVWGRGGVGLLKTAPSECRTDDIGGPVALPIDPSARKLAPRNRDWLALPSGIVFDLAGNEAEWMLDRYQRQDEPCWNDPATNVFHDPFCDTIGAFGDQRAARGGSWGETPAALQAVNRQIGDPDVGGFNLGFRCARPAL